MRIEKKTLNDALLEKGNSFFQNSKNLFAFVIHDQNCLIGLLERKRKLFPNGKNGILFSSNISLL